MGRGSGELEGLGRQKEEEEKESRHYKISLQVNKSLFERRNETDLLEAHAHFLVVKAKLSPS